jgi:hypothetical protein
MLINLAADVLIALGTMASFWISVATGHMDGEEIWRIPFVFLVSSASFFVYLGQLPTTQGNSRADTWDRCNVYAFLSSVACITI